MRTKSSTYLRLGIFVISGLIIFTLAIFFIGNRQHLFGDSLQVTSVFKNVNGLQVGNNVRFAGLDVGTVKQIVMMNDTSIAVNMFLDIETAKQMRENALATINSDGLVGSMIVNIIPGEGPGTRPLQQGDTLESISQVATADMLSTLNRTNENAALLTSDLLKITNAINSGEGVAGSLIKDDKMAEDLKESISNLRQTTKSTITSVNRLNNLLSRVNFDQNLAGLLLNDSLSAQRFASTLSNLDSSSVEINKITRDISAFTSDIKTGKGVINFMLTDTSFVNHLDGSLENIEDATHKFDQNMEALKHNFFFRGYFRRLERQKEKEAETHEP
ncbi:MAG TPA: MlaD family protein [Salegentibacter sp.]|uniref:MlaD family protein n=1 Tax=Salegentibacter sp. TaxID=1903072 RepID=UPI002F948633